MCLLLWVMKCQWFGFWSRDTGYEQRLLFMFGCRRRVQAAGRCCVSTHPSCWDDSPDGFTQFTPNHKLTGKAFVWEHPEERIYISDIFSAKTLICSCLPLCWMSGQVFFFYICFCLINICFTGELHPYKVWNIQIAFLDNCRVYV